MYIVDKILPPLFWVSPHSIARETTEGDLSRLVGVLSSYPESNVCNPQANVSVGGGYTLWKNFSSPDSDRGEKGRREFLSCDGGNE